MVNNNYERCLSFLRRDEGWLWFGVGLPSDFLLCSPTKKGTEKSKHFHVIFVVVVGLYDEERSQEEELDRALVCAEARLYFILCRGRPRREERRYPVGWKLHCGGMKQLFYYHVVCWWWFLFIKLFLNSF